MGNSNNLIKVLDRDKAKELESLGFKYIKESVNNDTVVYAFFVSKELDKYIKSNFETRDFFYNNTLCF